MIKTDELKELIKTVLYTGYIASEKPLSVFIVGNVGIGKSEILNSYKENENLAFFTDVTYMGLIKTLEEKKDLKHIVIPDFLKITMKKKSTSDNILSCFNAGIEEGIEKISMMGQQFDFKGKKFGLITATTRPSFYQNQKLWTSMGLLSRCLVISYDYSDKTKENIFDFIYNRKYLLQKGEKLELPFKQIEVTLPRQLAKKLRDKETDFRKQKQLQTLAMARAIMNGRTDRVVNLKDIQQVQKFKKFLNLEFTKI